MVPRDEQKGDDNNTNLHEKMQLLRSVTNSQAMSETSIIRDASKYIEELKHKVETANQHLLLASSASIVSTDNINYDINHHHNNNNPSSSSPPNEDGDEDGRMNTEMVIEAISRVIKDWNENKDGDGDVE